MFRVPMEKPNFKSLNSPDWPSVGVIVKSIRCHAAGHAGHDGRVPAGGSVPRFTVLVLLASNRLERTGMCCVACVLRHAPAAIPVLVRCLKKQESAEVNEKCELLWLLVRGAAKVIG